MMCVFPQFCCLQVLLELNKKKNHAEFTEVLQAQQVKSKAFFDGSVPLVEEKEHVQ